MLPKILIIAGITLLVLGLVTLWILNLPAFGTTPRGAETKPWVGKSHFREGKFWNTEPTPDLAPGTSYVQILWYFLFTPHPNQTPPAPLPALPYTPGSVKSDHVSLTWFGHSTYAMEYRGKTYLMDPVFGPRASFLSFVGPKPYPARQVYSPENFPRVDGVFISHDHFDHLDYPTIRALKDRVPLWVVPLGVRAHLEQWGIPPGAIRELDWKESTDLPDGSRITAVEARHFSGRGLIRNKSLWASYVFKIGDRKLFLGGDSGYGKHFAEIGAAYGPFDLCVLECGQYDGYWPYIHMMPEEVVQAQIDLGAKSLLPVHWGKFTLSVHPWDDPIRRVVAEGAKRNRSLATPKIGETMDLSQKLPDVPWWETVKP